jgi:catechol 2,3-dioxygenase-like lactoylglutathione lyase family enzyme
MPIVLNHTIVPVRDRVEAARFFAELFGVPYTGLVGPFAVVQVNDALSLDFAEDEVGPPHHFGFLVGDAEFDAILRRIRAAGVPHGPGFMGGYNGEIEETPEGRRVYFLDPNGHSYEIFTAP